MERIRYERLREIARSSIDFFIERYAENPQRIGMGDKTDTAVPPRIAFVGVPQDDLGYVVRCARVYAFTLRKKHEEMQIAEDMEITEILPEKLEIYAGDSNGRSDSWKVDVGRLLS